MKKFIFTTILLSLVTACNVDDVESDLIPVSGEEVVATNTVCIPDANNPPSVLGNIYLRTSFIIETPVDGNGDGNFSTDLEEEYSCSADPIVFRNDFVANNPVYNNVMLTVNNDSNGMLSQEIGCLIGDGLFPNYTQEANILRFCYNGEIAYTGTLSNNEQTLTFVFPYEEIFFGTNEILNVDGSIEPYQGNVTLIYTRQ